MTLKLFTAPVTGIGGIDYTVVVDSRFDNSYVHFDSVNGVAGQYWPIGTRGMPVNNWPDAVAIAARWNTTKVKLLNGVITLTANVTGMHFIGNSWDDPLMTFADNAIDLAGFTMTACDFELVSIFDTPGTGTLNQCGPFDTCSWIIVGNVTACLMFYYSWIQATNITGCSSFTGCYVQATAMATCYAFIDSEIVANTITGSFGFSNSGFVRPAGCVITGCSDISKCYFVGCTLVGCSNIIGCGSLNAITMDQTGIVADNIITSFEGGVLTITNLTAAIRLTISGATTVIIAASCTAGTIDVYGNARVINLSGGTVVNDYTTVGSSSSVISILASEEELMETGGTVVLDGTEQDVYINDAPAGVFEPLVVKIDFTNQTAAESVTIREYYRNAAAGAMVLTDTLVVAGVIAVPEIIIDLTANRFGVRVTIERTAGGAISYPWAVFHRS